MQLRQAEAVGVFYHHHRGVGHIHPHFNHRGSHENIQFAALEGLHHGIFVRRLHAPVHFADFESREHVAKIIVARFEVLQIAFFAALNKGKHHVNLPSGRQFAHHARVHIAALFLCVVNGLNRFAPGRQRVDDRHVEVAVDRHGKGARNGRGGHHEHVRRAHILLPQRGALLHAEAVLFVDDHETEVEETHRRFDKGVRAHKDMNRAVGDALHDFLARLAFHAAREEFHGDWQVGKLIPDGGKVLLGKYFGRCHDARLKTVVEREEAAKQSHDGLAAAHVALQQAVHLPPAPHVAADFADHALLRLGEFKGQASVVKLHEALAHFLELIALVVTPPARCRTQDIELEIEEFFKFEAVNGWREGER